MKGREKWEEEEEEESLVVVGDRSLALDWQSIFIPYYSLFPRVISLQSLQSLAAHFPQAKSNRT